MSTKIYRNKNIIMFAVFFLDLLVFKTKKV